MREIGHDRCRAGLTRTGARSLGPRWLSRWVRLEKPHSGIEELLQLSLSGSRKRRGLIDEALGHTSSEVARAHTLRSGDRRKPASAMYKSASEFEQPLIIRYATLFVDVTFLCGSGFGRSAFLWSLISPSPASIAVM